MKIGLRIAYSFLKHSLVLTLWCCAVHAAKLESLQVKEQAGKTLVSLSCSGRCTPKIFRLIKPERIVVDFANTVSTVQANKITLGHSLISHIRSGYSTPQSLRLVFDMKEPVSFNTTPSAQGLYIEFTAEKTMLPLPAVVSPRVAVNKRIIAGYETASIKPTSKPTAVRFSSGKVRDVVIVLDPGHGGKDPGAIGPKRSVEKNVTLAIALKLKQLINRQPGMRAVLTRDGDYYVGLRERLTIARKHRADIFISIHADAFINQQSNGASVFALSPRGATSEAAHWLAEKENNSELGGVNLAGLDDQNGVIRTVLIDLSQTATISASLQMGARVLQHLDNITKLHNVKVEQARFMVLKSPDIPSILIETGFISNPREEKNLTSPAYQAQMTQAIFNGLKRYFWDHPPQGTHVQHISNVTIHVVRKGESLPVIAARYHVNAAQLKRLNHLPSERVKAGQTLHIPSS